MGTHSGSLYYLYCNYAAYMFQCNYVKIKNTCASDILVRDIAICDICSAMFKWVET